MNSLKKLFSSFVSMMMIVSSVGAGSLGFANVASAATTGDLLKASGPAVYYYAQDGKRYVFPNEKTYFSWYNDFSSVKTISDAELAAISIGGNVTVRPGTKLVKIQTDPKVYAVTKCGVLHWVESETIAKNLYGDAWATRVIDVPDAFFVNYTIGSSVATSVHPDGQTITYNGDSNNYIVWGGQKRKFASSAAWTANMLNPLNSVMTTISYPNGSDVTGREGDIADVVCAGAVSTGALTVALAADTPAGATVPKNSASVPLAKYSFSAGTGDVVISGLTIHRVGVGAASDLANVYLYDQDGKRLTTGRTINSQSQVATFSSLSIAIPAGQAKFVYIYGDFSSPSATGGQHSFEIMDAASVVVGGSSTVSGSFPVRGNVFTVGTTLAARLDVNKGATPANPTVGASEAEISNFKLTANTNDVKVNQITVYQAGSVSNSDLTMMKLYQGNTLVGSADAVGSDGRIVIKFNPSYLITNGTTKVFSLKAKVGGRADRTIKTYVEYTTDVNATDLVYNAGTAVCIADTAIGGCTAAGQGSFDGEDDADDNFIVVTTQGGTLTNAFNGPATSNVAKGQLAVPLYKFALTAENNLEIRNMGFSINKSAGSLCYVRGTGTGAATDGTNYFRSIKIKNMDTGVTVMGPTELSSSLADQSTGSGTITLSDSFNMTAGQTLNLAIVADLSNSEDATGEFFGASDCGYKVTLNAFGSSDVRITETGEFLSTDKIIPNTAVVGNQLNVKASSLTMSLAGTPSSGTIVKKSANVPVAGIVVTAGAQASVLITSLTLTCQAQLAASGQAFGSAGALANCDQRITSLSLWDGTTQVGTAKAPDTTTGAAQITNMNFTVPGGSSKTLEVHATFSSTASTTAPFDQVSVGVAADADVVAQDADSNTVVPSRSSGLDLNADGASPSVKMTILNSGVVSYAADSNPVSTIVVAGKDVWVPFAQYKATAQYEALELDRVAVFASGTAAGTTHNSDNAVFAMIAVASGGAVKGSDILSAGTTGTKDVDLSNNKVVVPKDGSVQFQLWGKLSNIQSSSSVSGATTGVHRSGMQATLGLNSGLVSGEWDSNYFQSVNIRATGQASGERVYASSTNATHGNGMVTRKTKPTVTKQSLSSTTLANIDQDLMKFQVAADAAGSIALKQVMFSISKTSALTLSNFRVRKGSTEMALGEFAVNYASTTGGLTDIETGSVATTQNSGTVIVSFTNEESISGSGNVYTLHATVSGATSGQNVSLSFLRDSSSSVVTGYLVSNTYFGSNFSSSTDIYHVDTAVAPESGVGAGNATGTFLWSDVSEVPHSTAVGTSGGSRDWTNDVYIEDVSQSQTLSL
ncbi:MAG: hypothetical protein WC787_03115 [Patescibacteria group bacterium]|jgi:hypothetical protein